nr:hypothetical protein [uncultured Flavobacterium sp.]
MKTAIVNAMELCGTEGAKDEMVFANWGEEAEKEIGSRYQFIKKIAVIDINNCSACLPSDAAYVQRALLGDYGCDCTDLFYRWCGAAALNNADFATNAGPSFIIVDAPANDSNWTSSWWNYTVQYELQNNKIVFYSNLDGQKVTVQYLAYDTDCDGFLNINENHVRALTYYMCWMYNLRKKRKSNDDFYSANKYEAMWERECANARGKDNVLTESQRANIVAELHDPISGIGLATGMVGTLGGWGWWNNG